jgi:hypothetical protein
MDKAKAVQANRAENKNDSKITKRTREEWDSVQTFKN